MFSLATIISIYAEIFTAGIFLGSLAGIILKYRASKQKQKSDIYLSFVFLCYILYIAGTIISQLMFNYDRPLSDLIIINKIISFDMIFCSFFLGLFIIEDFLPFKLIFSILMAGVTGVFIFFTAGASVNLIFGLNVIEPISQYTPAIPIKPLWISMWILSSAVYFWNFIKAKTEGGKNLFLLGSISCAIIASAQGFVYLYLVNSEALFLLASWIIIFLGSLGLYLSRVIAPDLEIAKTPLLYFRTRILYKLVLIFVLLVVVLFQVTIIFTLSISRNALKERIIKEHQEAAISVASKINFAFLKENKLTDANISTLQNIVEDFTNTNYNSWAYVVDQSGRLIAHPDKIRAKVKEDFNGVSLVKSLLSGKTTGVEFYSKEGDKMVGATYPVGKFGLGVVVEEPSWIAYSELRRMENSTLIFSIIGILFTIILGTYFARSIEKSIYTLIKGTEAVKEGDLSYRIKMDSLDELGQLADAINSMTNELRESQEHLISAEKLGALGTMAAGMAHEIKNPLVSLKTFTQLATQKWDDEEFRKKFAAILPAEIDKINKIVEHLLRFGRPTKPEMKSINVNTILEEVMGLLDSECKKFNIRLSTRYNDLPEIMGDAGQLSQAFVNIVLNSIQSMPNGGEINIKTDFGQIIKLGRVSKYGIASTEGETAQISWEEGRDGKPYPVVFIEITDSGCGIPEENLRSLFDPFFTTKPKGTGMGLAITLRIIEEHKGSIKVRSRIGKGTTFIITLPQVIQEYHHKLVDDRPKRQPKDGMP